MRVNPNAVPDMLAAMQQSQAALQVALQQVSTGKSVTMPSDNPTASADMVQNTIESGEVDQYTKNVSSVLSNLQTADSALSTVVSSLTSAVSLGTQGANGTSTAANRQALATQVQGLLSTVVSQANLSSQGAYLFGGTATTTTPFTVNGSGYYAYNCNSDTNSVPIGDNQSLQVNLPGDQIFTNPSANVLGSLTNLSNALQYGTSSDIAAATTAVSAALGNVSQARIFYGNAESQLNSQETYLQQETLTLTAQATSLVGVDEATAATNLAQAETANSATLAAAAKVLPNTLLNYLSNPS